MADYRLYSIDRSTNHIRDAEWISADSDAEAVADAFARARSIPSELWVGTRLIARIPARPASAAASWPLGGPL